LGERVANASLERFHLSRPTAATKLAVGWMSTARTLPWHCTQEEEEKEEEEEEEEEEE